MKNVILFLTLLICSSCIAQKNIKSINDTNLIDNIVLQFSTKAKIKINNSVFALYFQENPEITEVVNGIENKQPYNGYTITVYRFESKNQISEFIRDYNVYQKKNIFFIFDKRSNPEFLRRLKKNQLSLSKTNLNTNSGYNHKSWVLNFNLKNQLEKCYPYDCN